MTGTGYDRSRNAEMIMEKGRAMELFVAAVAGVWTAIFAVSFCLPTKE